MEHDAELRLARAEWRLDALDRWRDRVDGRMTAMAAEIERLDRADEIAQKVATAVRGERRLQLTLLQKAGGLLVLGLTVADLIRGILG